MLYLLAVINLVLTGLCGLSFFNIYKSTKGLGLLEMAVMWISIVLLLVTNIGIIWVNDQRGKVISELQRKKTMLEQEMATQKKKCDEDKKELNA